MSSRGGNNPNAGQGPKAEECVKVVVRIRPLSSKEIQDGRTAAAEAIENRGEIVVRNPKLDEREAPKSFTFDAVFGEGCTQKQVYETCAAPVVESVLNGYNGTIFAYGQTGAGKTHTMEGYPDPPDQRGIIPNSFKHIFDRVAISENQQFLVRASYLEIYNEEIRDLLSKDPRNRLEIKENADSGVYVKDLTSFVVKSAQEIDNVMQAGKKNRSVGATLMNQTSSRSHSIFTIIVECASTSLETDKQHIRVGKLNLVDLAGSERQSKTGATGDRLKEATKINLSLSALGNVISALVDGKSQYIPYRDSKLTRLLQDSLGGNTKTVMCANCGPAEYNYDETISTLRYANRAKNIKNKPRINEDPKDAMLREFQEEIQRLRAQLAAQEKGMVLVDGKELPWSSAAQAKEEVVIEKVVEKVVEREVRVDLSEEKVKELEIKAEKEKEELKMKAKQDMDNLLRQQNKTVEEREALKERLNKEAEARESMLQERVSLQDKLQAMQEKLIQGGEMLDKAAKQEALLRKAKIELDEQQQQQVRLAQELADKEESHLMLEEQYSSLQEEIEVKTKKLKKLWNKYQAANREVQDLQEEFQREREDMLDTIRQLTRQIKLKDLIINNFVPPEESKKVERRSKWNEELDTWIITRLDFAGNNLRGPRRPMSSAGLRRPETEYARSRKQYEKNPRYKYDNIINMELDMPEGTTQNYLGANMVSNVAQVLNIPLDADGEEVVLSGSDHAVPTPYMHYSQEDAERMSTESVERSERPKSARRSVKTASSSNPSSSSSSKTKSSSRPKTSSSRLREEAVEPKRRSSLGLEEEEFKGYEEHYPSARGLVGK